MTPYTNESVKIQGQQDIQGPDWYFEGHELSNMVSYFIAACKQYSDAELKYGCIGYGSSGGKSW